MPLDQMDADVIDRKYLYGRSILCFQDYNQMMDAFAGNSRTSATAAEGSRTFEK